MNRTLYAADCLDVLNDKDELLSPKSALLFARCASCHTATEV